MIFASSTAAARLERAAHRPVVDSSRLRSELEARDNEIDRLRTENKQLKAEKDSAAIAHRVILNREMIRGAQRDAQVNKADWAEPEEAVTALTADGSQSVTQSVTETLVADGAWRMASLFASLKPAELLAAALISERPGDELGTARSIGELKADEAKKVVMQAFEKHQVLRSIADAAAKACQKLVGDAALTVAERQESHSKFVADGAAFEDPH